MESDDEVDRLRAALVASPSDVRLLHRLADVHIRRGGVVDAADALVRAAAIHAQLDSSELDSSEARSELAAIALLLHALRLVPSMHSARVILAKTYLRFGMRAEAIEQADALARLADDHAAADARLQIEAIVAGLK